MGDAIRLLLRGIGQLLVTAGVVVLLFVVYEVYVTNIFADEKQAHVASVTERQWERGKNVLLPLPGSSDPTIPLGEGIANLYIPRLGRDFHFFIVQGSAVPDDAQLEEGPAHYGDSALPGQVGNFAVAGHRVGKGEPFLNLDKLGRGDPIVVETKSAWLVYRVTGHEVVDPSDGEVVLPVPDQPGATPTRRLLTLTTCTPKFTATQRLVVHAALDGAATVRVRATRGAAVLHMPASISRLYDSEVN